MQRKARARKRFIKTIKGLKYDRPLAREILDKIQKSNSDYTIFDKWKKNFEFLGFNFETYSANIKKKLRLSFEKIVIYYIYYFTISSILVDLVLNKRKVVNAREWVEKQIFTPFLIANNPQIAEKILVQLGDFQEFVILINEYDILKIVFEEIFPAKIRKTLGEFYTPDWLVELVLRGCNNFEEISIVDPSCGSGTFLVKTLREKFQRKEIQSSKDVLHILDSVLGFDINIIAVQIARLNILTVISEFISDLDNPVTMPVYFTDSIVNPFISETKGLNTFSKENEVQEVVIFSKKGLHMTIPPIKTHTSFPSFELYSILKDRLRSENLDIFQLEFILGSYIAYKHTQRDLAIGNPPWLAWDEINSGYRNILAERWNFLFTQKGWRAKIAAGRVDLSAIFVYSCHTNFVKKSNGKMVFVLPISLFKSKSAAEGFRRFKSPKGVFKPDLVWDFSKLAIFPSASNNAVVTFFESGKKPIYPIKWISYNPKNEKRISPFLQTEEVLSSIVNEEMVAFPISQESQDSSWVSVKKEDIKIIQKLEGNSYYRARGGINTGGANTIFWVEILEEEGDFVKVRNVGKSIRAETKQIEGIIEKKIVHPLIRGRDISRWNYKSELGLITPYNPIKNPKSAIAEKEFSYEFPETYRYLKNFERELRSRKEFIRWGARGPFYELYRIGPYTFAPYKVIWPHTGFTNQMNCCVLSDESERALMDQKVILTAFESQVEAHYFCALLNSDLAFKFLRSYLILDASTHILTHLNIPKFDPESQIHHKLAELSIMCHEVAKNGGDYVVQEKGISNLAKKVWAS